MVIGLELFKKHFAPFKDQYILIGGTACAVIMEDSGLDFRSTKDLDIVLYVEALSANFVAAFWQFIEAGGYSNQQHSTGKEIFYRFTSPKAAGFPFMLELFSRRPDTVLLTKESRLTPIPMLEAIKSLSAILLDEDYYEFIHSGKREMDGLSILDAEHLIPLKARACIDLEDRKKNGVITDERDIRKHRNDIIRLYQLLSPNQQLRLPQSIKQDLQIFLERLRNNGSIDCKALGLPHTSGDRIIAALEGIYGLKERPPV